MAELDTDASIAVWNAYIEKFGYEPTDATQLQKFSKSSAGKHVSSLSFKDAREVYKLYKGQGKIGGNSNKKSSKSPKPKTPRTPKSPPSLSMNKSGSLSPTPMLTGSKKKNKSKSPSSSPRFSHKKRKSNSNTPKKPPNLKNAKSSSTSSNSSNGQLSPPIKTKKKNKSHHKLGSKTKTKGHHKKSSSNLSRKSGKGSKKKSKSKKGREPREREIRSKLNNDPNDKSLDSMLEILRRATLVKKQQKLFKEQEELLEREARERIEREAKEAEDAREKEADGLDANTIPGHAKQVSSIQLNDLTKTDIAELREEEIRKHKQTADRFNTVSTPDGTEMNMNPLLTAQGRRIKKYSLDETLNSSSEEEEHNNYGVEHNGNKNGFKAPTLDVIDDEKELNMEGRISRLEANKNTIDEDDEDGYETPPELFRADNEWDWTEKDIIFEQSLNYGISLQLLHLGLTQGPLFPNSILKWSKLTFKENGPTPRSGHVSSYINDKMVIFGGYCKQMLTDHIFLVDVGGDFDIRRPLEVTPISSLEKIHKTYRVGHCGVSLQHNNCLYLFGGWNDQEYINHGLLFNVDSLKLVVEQTKDRLLPPPRRDHTLCKMGPYLLLFGGWSHDYDGNELWLLGSNWKWQQLEITGTAPCSRRGHSANVIGSKMFIFGGLYGFSKYLNDLHIYDGDNNEWIQPELVGITRPPPRAWHTSTIIGQTQILFYGGTSGRSDFLNDCWVFDTVGYFWFQVECHGRSPLPRCSHSMVKVFEDRTFLQEPYTNECIRITKEGKIEDAEHRRDRLKLLMFGGLVAIDHVEEEKKKEEEQEDDKDNDKKKGKKNKNGKRVSKKMKKKKQASNLLDEVKADISKQQNKQKRRSKLEKRKSSKLGTKDDDKKDIEDDDDGEEDQNDNDKPGGKAIFVSMDGLEEKKENDAHKDDGYDDDYSESSSDSDIGHLNDDHINRIELSDDLYVLMLEI